MRIRQGITAACSLPLSKQHCAFQAQQAGAPPKTTYKFQAEQACRGGGCLKMEMVWKGEVLSVVPGIPLQPKTAKASKEPFYGEV